MQGSELGTKLFILFTHSLYQMLHNYPNVHQLYDKDTKIYKSCAAYEIMDTSNNIKKCISNVKTWIGISKLQMNDKTEVVPIAQNGSTTHDTLTQTLNL